MTNKRVTYTNAQQTALISQVDRACPRCAKPLFYKKNSKSYKGYELAHIYPLNPTSEEMELLANENRLSMDLNDENNIIPLCKSCHGEFDTPRTVEEYRELVAIKQKIMERTKQIETWHRYHIEDAIEDVIKALFDDTSFDLDADIKYIPKEVDAKIDSTMSRPTYRKIRNYVSDYYIFVRKKLSTLDTSGDCLSEVISQQIKTYYVAQKKSGLTQQVVFENIVDWLNIKTKPETKDAAEIIVSFFIQNCEVFE